MSKFIFGFSLGIVAGSLVTYKLVKDKFEKLAQEEIDSVKEVFSKRQKRDNEKKEDIYEPDDKDIEEYSDRLKELRYTNYSDITKKENKKEVEPVDCKPCVIPPNEFGENEDYETISLTYYSDKVLCDEDDEPVEDVEATVGEASLETFGDYEDDSVFVRNDRLKCYFEILLDYDRYSDVVKRRPH